MTVVILGAEGFIGRALRRRLARHHRLLSVDIKPITPVRAMSGFAEVEESLLRCDLGDHNDVDGMVKRLEQCAPVTAVVHLAAYYDFANRPDPRYQRLESGLTRLMSRLDESISEETPVIYASSMAALESTDPGRPLGPNAPKHSGWQYPRHKVACEKILDETPTNRAVIQLVLAGVYSDCAELVPLYQQLRRVAAGSIESMLYPGMTNRGLTYVHRDDAIEAFALAVECFRGVHDERVRLMIGEPEPVTYETIHQLASEIIRGRRLPLFRIPGWLAWLGGGVLSALGRVTGQRRFVQPWMVRYAGEHFELDVSMAQTRLGWSARHRLSERLTRIVEFSKYHPALFEELNRMRPW